MRVGMAAVCESFYRDRSFEPRVAGTIDLTHTARAERPDNLIRAQESASGDRHHSTDGEPQFSIIRATVCHAATDSNASERRAPIRQRIEHSLRTRNLVVADQMTHTRINA